VQRTTVAQFRPARRAARNAPALQLDFNREHRERKFDPSLVAGRRSVSPNLVARSAVGGTTNCRTRCASSSILTSLRSTHRKLCHVSLANTQPIACISAPCERSTLVAPVNGPTPALVRQGVPPRRRPEQRWRRRPAGRRAWIQRATRRGLLLGPPLPAAFSVRERCRYKTLWSVAPPVIPATSSDSAIADILDVTVTRHGLLVRTAGGTTWSGPATSASFGLLNPAPPAVGLRKSSEDHPFHYGPGTLFGSSVAACGDINGDGFAEVAIGAPARRRVTYVVLKRRCRSGALRSRTLATSCVLAAERAT